MDITTAIAKATHWRNNPRTRPTAEAARSVSAVLADRIAVLEQELVLARSLAIGRQVILKRGSPERGPETGPGFGRDVPAVIEAFPDGVPQIQCRLLVDDPHAVGEPCRAGDIGFWAPSQVTGQI